MKSKTATATAVAAGLTCAAEVAGSGFFGPLGQAAPTARGSTSKRVSVDPASRWLGVEGAQRRSARRKVTESLYEIRGGALGGWLCFRYSAVVFCWFSCVGLVVRGVS